MTSGAIACGLGPPGHRASAPRALPDLQAASAVGQGVLFQRYSEAFAPARRGAGPGAAHLQRPGRARLLPQRAHHPAPPHRARARCRSSTRTTPRPPTSSPSATTTCWPPRWRSCWAPRWLLLLTDREGLYGDGPRRAAAAGRRPRRHAARATCRLADMSGSGRGRGGIASKIASASMATGGGVTCVIASGTAEGVIPGVASGHHVGTRFSAAARPEAAFKLWLRHAKPTLGRVRGRRRGGARPCASAARRCWRWAWSPPRGASRPATRWRWSSGPGRTSWARASRRCRPTRSAPGRRPQVGRGARAPARRGAPGDPPRRVRAGRAARRADAGGGEPWSNGPIVTRLERVVADVHAASRVLGRLPGHRRDAALVEMADALERRSDEILRDNALDVEAAKRAHTAPALIDRLLLDEDRVRDMADGIRAVAALPDPVGEIDGGPAPAQRPRHRAPARARSASSRSSTRAAPTSPPTRPPSA